MGFFGKRKSYVNCFYELSSYKVKDIMAKDVVSIHREDKLIDAAHTMIGAHVSCLVVLEGSKPVGIITERDFIKKLSMSEDQSEKMIVNDIITKKLFTVNTHLDLFKAQKIMKEHNFRKLVVVENEELKGIITQTDLCRTVANLKSPHPKGPLVKDVMTRKVLAVAEDDRFVKAKKIMATKDIGSVIVADNNKIKGVFTEFDIVSEFFLNPNRLKNSYMKDLMTSPVVCVTPDFDLFQVNELMLEHNFRRLPVVDNHKILGILTQTDVARKLYSFIEKNTDYVEDRKAVKKQKKASVSISKTGNIIMYFLKADKDKEEKKDTQQNVPEEITEDTKEDKKE